MANGVKSPLIVWLVAAVVALATLGSGVVIWVTRINAIDEARENVHTFASIYASETDASIQSIEIALRDLEERIDLLGVDGAQEFKHDLGTEAVHLLLRNYLVRLQQAEVMTIADRDGNVINFTRSWPAPNINLSDRDYFQHAKANADENLYVSAPIADEVVGSRTVYFSMRISGRNGEFAGIVAVGVSVETLKRIFSAIQPAQHQSFMLSRSDGTVIVQSSDSVSPNPAQIVGAQPLDHYSLVVNVGVSQAAALAKWHDLAMIAAGGATLVALCLGILLWRLTSQFRNLVRAEEHQALLISELDHRVKNILARIVAVVKYTRQGSRSMDEFVSTLNGRIQAMADAHALLSQNQWHGVSLADLVRRQLAPYATETNIAIKGPDIPLSTAETQAVAMVLQELVTNAVKYGALSTPVGKVSVNWDRRDHADGTSRLGIAWREFGGPPTSPPTHYGYGTSLIRDLIPHELGGTVSLEFAPEGLRCDIEIQAKAPPKK
jgi:two-component sensor histidine kinase